MVSLLLYPAPLKPLSSDLGWRGELKVSPSENPVLRHGVQGLFGILYPVVAKPSTSKIIKRLSNLGAHLASLYHITTTGLITSTLPGRFPSIGK
jgi:hypothetical protein